MLVSLIFVQARIYDLDFSNVVSLVVGLISSRGVDDKPEYASLLDFMVGEIKLS